MARQRRNWTTEEDGLLRRAVNSATQGRPLLWRELAKVVPGRSNKDCRRRWWNSLAEGISKGPWSEEEDERLIEAVAKYGPAWSQVAGVVGSRNADQCSSHWGQVLDPTINFCDWTPDEDQQLLHSVLTHGTNWATIAAAHVPRRTTLALKNRYSTLRLRHENDSRSNEDGVAKTPDAILTSFEAYSASSRPRNAKRRKVSVENSGNIDGKPAGEAKKEVQSDDNRGGMEDAEAEDCGEEEEDDDSNGDSGDSSSKSPSIQFGDISETHRPDYRADAAAISTPPWPDITTMKRSNLHCNDTFNPGIVTPPMVPETSDQIVFDNAYPLHQLSPQVGLWIKDPAAMGSGIPCTYDSVAMSTADYAGSLAPSPLSPSYAGLVQTPAPSQYVRVEGTEPQVLRDVPMSATSGAVFHVSIEMACSKLQMDAVLAGLAGAGTPVSMKINLKYS